jgi:carboxyl-terminal processing protease
MFTRLKSFVRDKKHQKHALIGLVVVFAFMLGTLAGRGQLRVSPNTASTSSLPTSIDYSSVDELYQTLREKYDGKLTEEQVLSGLKHGLANGTKDPYTEYFSAEEAQEFSNDLQGTFSGIGAQLERDTNENIVVVAPIEGSPAAAAGVRPGDVIASIDGKSASGLTTTEAVTKIRGKKGTKVTIVFVRNKSERVELTITRDEIKVPSVTAKILDGNVGYLQVNQYSGDTDELALAEAKKFKAAGVKKVILDLRDNPGGEVESAVNLTSLWLPAGETVMQERSGKKLLETYSTSGESPLQGVATVVLINGGSASASEITALALSDAKVATVIGEQSYGKGVVQEVLELNDGGQLKVTVAKWYSPKGKNIDKKGITPDQVVKMTEDDYKNNTDPQLKAAETYLNKN